MYCIRYIGIVSSIHTISGPINNNTTSYRLESEFTIVHLRFIVLAWNSMFPFHFSTSFKLKTTSQHG